MSRRPRTGTSAARKAARAKKEPRRRLDPQRRSQEILRGAITFFAEHGFSGQTRELTRRLGISKGLLYRYFSSKDALIDRIYEEVFLRRWRPEWESTLADRSQPLLARLKRFYLDYAKMLHDYEWVRIYLFSGLAGASINQRFGKLVIETIYKRVIGELRHEFGRPGLAQRPMSELEAELMWSLHGGIFYIGVRKWVYHVPVPKDVDATIERLVEGFYGNARDLMTGGDARGGALDAKRRDSSFRPSRAS
jgi:AcrR family transcriptional regulator